MTTVAAFGKYDAELLCYAHSKGARLVLKGRLFYLPVIIYWNSSVQKKINVISMKYLYLFVCLFVFFTGDVPLLDIVDAAKRKAWIMENVNLAKRQFMDGINIDIEQAVEESSPEYHALTALVKETTEMFHREIPGSQV